jgi:hypothetical protein
MSWLTAWTVSFSGGEQHRLAVGVLDRLPGAGQFHLLDTRIRDQERDPLSRKFVTHDAFLHFSGARILRAG